MLYAFMPKLGGSLRLGIYKNYQIALEFDNITNQFKVFHSTCVNTITSLIRKKIEIIREL